MKEPICRFNFCDNMPQKRDGARPPRLLDGRSALLFTATLVVYLSDGGIHCGSDTWANTYLAVNVAQRGSLFLRPEDFPILFSWTPVRPNDPEQPPHDAAPAPPSFERAVLEKVNPRSGYSVVPAGSADPGGMDDSSASRSLSVARGRFVNTFGSGTGAIAAPFFALAEALAGHDIRRDVDLVFRTAKLAAATISALAAAVMFSTCRLFLPERDALVVYATYAFGTSLWGVCSQGLWQHTAAQLCLGLGLHFVLRLCVESGAAAGGASDPAAAGVAPHAAAAAALSAAVFCRPTAALPAAALGTFVALRSGSDVRGVAAFCATAAAGASLFVAHNRALVGGSGLWGGQGVVGGLVATEKTGDARLWATPLWEGAAGLLVSPGRGLFFHSPVLLFAAAAAPRQIARGWAARLEEGGCAWTLPVGAAVAAMWSCAFKWFDWWGGWTFSYRPLVDSVPLLLLLLAASLRERGFARRSRAWRAGFALSLLASAAVQLAGARGYSPHGWHARRAHFLEPAARRTAGAAGAPRFVPCDARELAECPDPWWTSVTPTGRGPWTRANAATQGPRTTQTTQTTETNALVLRYTFDPQTAERWSAQTGRPVQTQPANVDDAEWRHRLWSLRDNEVLSILGDFAGARRRRSEAEDRERSRHRVEMELVDRRPVVVAARPNSPDGFADSPRRTGFFRVAARAGEDVSAAGAVLRRSGFGERFGVGFGPLPARRADASRTRVAFVEPGGLAARAGVAAGAEVLAVNGVGMRGAPHGEALQRVLERTHHGLVMVLRWKEPGVTPTGTHTGTHTGAHTGTHPTGPTASKGAGPPAEDAPRRPSQSQRTEPTPEPSVARVFVRGAGESGLDGAYVKDPKRPRFLLRAGRGACAVGCWVQRHASKGQSYWMITNHDGSRAFYALRSAADWPPERGWSPLEGKEPAPSVSREPGPRRPARPAPRAVPEDCAHVF
jgi:hypothetical protein